MHGIPQEIRIAHDDLLKHLERYLYHPSIKNPGLWRNNSRPINFTLVVDDFGIKYLGKEHALHLISALEDKYKVATYWEVKLYTGIALNWDYEKGTVKLSIPGYLLVSPKRPQDSL